jgi:hypothetical protein
VEATHVFQRLSFAVKKFPRAINTTSIITEQLTNMLILCKTMLGALRRKGTFDNHAGGLSDGTDASAAVPTPATGLKRKSFMRPEHFCRRCRNSPVRWRGFIDDNNDRLDLGSRRRAVLTPHFTRVAQARVDPVPVRIANSICRVIDMHRLQQSMVLKFSKEIKVEFCPSRLPSLKIAPLQYGTVLYRTGIVRYGTGTVRYRTVRRVGDWSLDPNSNNPCVHLNSTVRYVVRYAAPRGFVRTSKP